MRVLQRSIDIFLKTTFVYLKRDWYNCYYKTRMFLHRSDLGFIRNLFILNLYPDS